jgi:hypothetical protein
LVQFTGPPGVPVPVPLPVLLPVAPAAPVVELEPPSAGPPGSMTTLLAQALTNRTTANAILTTLLL